MHTQILHLKACLHRADARYFVALIGEVNQFLHAVIQADGFISRASSEASASQRGMISLLFALSYDAVSATRVAEMRDFTFLCAVM
jgi:hypothetical protein